MNCLLLPRSISKGSLGFCWIGNNFPKNKTFTASQGSQANYEITRKNASPAAISEKSLETPGIFWVLLKCSEHLQYQLGRIFGDVFTIIRQHATKWAAKSVGTIIGTTPIAFTSEVVPFIILPWWKTIFWPGGAPFWPGGHQAYWMVGETLQQRSKVKPPKKKQGNIVCTAASLPSAELIWWSGVQRGQAEMAYQCVFVCASDIWWSKSLQTTSHRGW